MIPITAAPSYEQADPDPLAELLAFLRRRIDGDYEVDEFGYDPELTDKVFLELVRPLYNHWFRVETVELHNVPEEGGALVVANHSGTLPIDALMLQVAMHDDVRRPLRLLGADLVYQLPLLSHLARKTGHTLACREDADRLLRKGELVGVFPEGFKGVGKPFSERYKLQRFGRGGFVASAIRAGVPILPTAIVGAEEIYPKIGDVKSLARLLGLPYVPITPFFPLLGPLGLVPLPSKWMIEFGEPIRTDHYEPEAADDPMLVFNVTDHVREVIQQMLNELRLRRGHAFPPFF
ncbi:lysophospholipid acyltransferase family protein [Nonomuraea wenchangensis]